MVRNQAMKNIIWIAGKLDATPLYDKDGDIAMLGNLYDKNGVEIVRYAPDPSHFLPEHFWLHGPIDALKRSVC